VIRAAPQGRARYEDDTDARHAGALCKRDQLLRVVVLGWRLARQLGDYMNGYKAEQTFDDDKLEDAADWLIEEGKRAFPDSDFSKAFGSALR
jgi:hypothetical protein